MSDDVIALNAANSIMIDSSGEVVVKADGNITVTTPEIIITAPKVTIIGNVKITGDLTVSGIARLAHTAK